MERENDPPALRHSEQTARRQSSIAMRLRWSYLLTSTLPLLLIGTLLIVIGFRTQQENVYNNQRVLARSIGRDIAIYLSSLESQILRIGSTFDSDFEQYSLRTSIQDLLRANYPDIRQLIVVDRAGRELIFAPFEGESSYNSLKDYSHDRVIRSALQGEGQRGDIYLSSDGTPLFSLVLPLRNDSGQVVGAIRGEISAVFIDQSLRTTTTETVQAYLINSKGEVMLGAPSERRVNSFSPQPSFNATDDVAQYQGIKGVPVVGARFQISPVGWWVVTEQLTSEAFASSWRSTLILVALVVVVGMLALGWALRQARLIIEPLQELGRGVAALGQGKLDHRIQVVGSDEVSEMARTFNQMAEHLQLSLAAIEDQNERLRHGLALARDIQAGLLPSTAPWQAGSLQVAARSLPAYEVGGDFYTYVSLPHEQAGIAVGDISGKGVGAALLMALTSSVVENQARHAVTPVRVLNGVQRTLLSRMQANRMNAAVLYALFDTTSSQLRVANAGMMAPLIMNPDGVRTIDVAGFPIGAYDGAVYREQKVILEPGDMVLFFTDGLVEAHNEEGEIFGFERLEALLSELSPNTDPDQLVNTIIERVQVFMGEAEQHDDITLVAVQPINFQQAARLGDQTEVEVYAS
jgi:Serine phosphatase RsbU, regulator of sigma subunit